MSSALEQEVRPERGPIVNNTDFTGDAAVQQSRPVPLTLPNAPAISNPLLTFEGLSNQDNFNIFGFRVTPPDPSGAVGPNHYVEMVNLVFAVYSKTGTRLAGPIDTGALWAGFAIPDCTDPSGDPIVVYDRHEDRWLLTQFTTSGMNPDGSFNGKPFYNCVAISQTEDPTGTYFRYAFITSAPGSVPFFPDYPKYGVWRDSYLITSRDFGPTVEYGISVYALEKEKMIQGDPNARMVHFFLDSAVVPISQIGAGLLPADIDGEEEPDDGAPAPIVGTMDDDGPYNAPFDALNIYELTVDWQNLPAASLNLVTQLPVAEFNSTFPCTDTITPPPSSQTRSCIPQPGTTRKIDILSYRQRPTWRLSYRNFGTYEAMVTNQSVQARKGIAGVRWYEIRRTSGQFSLFQQGTFAPEDGIHRWMGSIAMDKQGNMALGYSVSNSTDVFPGIRYTGRLKGDPLGQMTLGEGVIVNGSGSQLSRFSRWGDYTSMNVDPTDECTFWYVNEYYTTTSAAGWQTRIGSFRLPGCTGEDEEEGAKNGR
ncbi:MAG TPA: hypothetical protein VHM88_09115 [Candidatus Acidoferrales bacterium]|nr:hypothetical protein [Candidatus Acidoferrales bacterium]